MYMSLQKQGRKAVEFSVPSLNLAMSWHYNLIADIIHGRRKHYSILHVLEAGIRITYPLA